MILEEELLQTENGAEAKEELNAPVSVTEAEEDLSCNIPKCD